MDYWIVLDRARDFISKIQNQTKFIRVYTVEPRDYAPHNRFGVSTINFLQKRRKYNRQLKRWLKKKHFGHVDIGKPWIAYNRTADGVHFNKIAVENFKKSIIRVILGVRNSVPH